MDDIRETVEQFMLKTGMSARALSAAVGHPHSARRILAGRDVRASTAKKLSDFIAAYPGQVEGREAGS
jgi:hypothetical protein